MGLVFGHELSLNSFTMGKRGRDAAAADYKPTGMDRSELAKLRAFFSHVDSPKCKMPEQVKNECNRALPPDEKAAFLASFLTIVITGESNLQKCSPLKLLRTLNTARTILSF